MTWREQFLSLKGTWSIIVLFIIVMGGIYVGIVTPTEAAAVGAAGACLLGFLTKRLDTEKFKLALTETVMTTSGIFALVLGAKLFVGFIALTGVAGALTEWATSWTWRRSGFWCRCRPFTSCSGRFMDPSA